MIIVGLDKDTFDRIWALSMENNRVKIDQKEIEELEAKADLEYLYTLLTHCFRDKKLSDGEIIKFDIINDHITISSPASKGTVFISSPPWYYISSKHEKFYEFGHWSVWGEWVYRKKITYEQLVVRIIKYFAC